MSLLSPAIFALMMFVYVKLISDISVDTTTVLVADQTQWISDNIPDTELFKFRTVEPIPLNILREIYSDSESAVILYIEGEIGQYPVSFSMYSKKTVNIDLQDYIKKTVAAIIEARKLAEYNIANLDDILAEIRTTVNMRIVKWGRGSEDRVTDTTVIMAVSYAMALILYFFIFMFGAMVMRGVIEEKVNRIIEVMVSSVSPFQLMTGKIVGIALVAVLQFTIWITLSAVMMAIIPSMTIDSAALVGELNLALSDMNLGTMMIVFILFFLGGYLLYASMFAAIGSTVELESDSQQLMSPVTVPLIIAIMILVHTFRYPDSNLSVWASMIPFTSPIIMVARVPFGVPTWQIILSFTLLISTFVVMLHLTAKIYRVGILMHGKQPSLREIVKWLKYK
jgi:ABC-2 type transport system permease protein